VSNHSAIAAVTATLTNMIQSAVNIDAAVAGSKVTARPPDRARQGAPGNQINLFLYRTSIDAAWRNHDPAGMRAGESGQPPLPLVLTYLVTAYGENDDEILGHRLLGIAMGVLNDRPVLSRADILNALQPGPGSELEDQVERVRISPDPRPQDEISRMWSTFGTGYRLSVSYDAAVVLIDSTRPVSAPMPVLARGSGDLGPAVKGALLPSIELVLPPDNRPAAAPGDTVTLVGRNLDAAADVQVTGLRLAAAETLASVPAEVPSAITVQIPPAGTLPAGTVALAARIAAEGGPPVPGSPAPLALAPTITSFTPRKPKLDARGAISLKVKCSPAVRPSQTIALLLDDQLATLPPVTAPTSELVFAIAGLVAGHRYTLRLRIDSVDSIPLATAGKSADPGERVPLTFDPSQQVTPS
jgi:hypothetical protein